MEDDPIVERKINKKYLKMRKSHKLPFYYENCYFYDRALPRICEKIKGIEGHLKFIDIGANVGDTVSLVTDKISGSFLCVDGDEEYLPFLKINTSRIKGSDIFIEESYCADDSIKKEKFKINRENGTARLEKNSENINLKNIEIKTLDDILKKYPLFKETNLLKIDTDGFEMNVLRGGKNFLEDAKPSIYFEFDPELYLINNTDPLDVFDFLYENGYREALFYDNFGVPIKILDISNKNEINELINLIDKKRIYYFDILIFHYSKKDNYESIFKSELFSVLSLSNDLLNSAKIESNSVRIELNSIKTKLAFIYSSREWKIILKMKKIFEFFFPLNSLRRKILVSFFRIFRRIFKFIFRVKIKISAFFLIVKYYVSRFKPRKKRKINLKSKKLVYIGHSYHNKTKSTGFLIDYLKESFDVEVVLDESWQGKPAPDLSFIDKNYLGVIFFQLLPSKEIIKSIKNDNIIYFPMYDQSGRLNYDYWNNYRDLKIINFSSTLHEKLKKWRFESMYVQYFPKPQDFIPGKKDEVFFWQRLTKIAISTIIKLLNKERVKIHIHKAIDPDQEFISPQKEDEEKFQITYSDWFETREEMWDVIKQKGIYVAPREYEGIGLSFLEAMSMGKAVVAVNNPTMNEYIEHGKNGYLYDLDNPKEIDLSNIEEVQRNTHQYMQEGYQKWEKDKRGIIDFIKKA